MKKSEYLEPDYKVGDYVLWILDGDIGKIVEVDHSCEEPFKVEWFLTPSQSAWHSAFSDDDGHPSPAMVILGA